MKDTFERSEHLIIIHYLPGGLTQSEFFEGYFIPRNTELMRVIKDLDLVEHRGSGIPRITQFFSPDSFHFTDNFLRLRFPAIEPVHTESEVEAPVTQDVMEPESRPESRPESELAIRILTFLHTENKSKADLALSLGHKTISGELNNQIRALLAADFIERALPDKPNSACNDIG